MAHSYNFAIIAFAPDDIRDERVNVGVAIVQDGELEIRLPRRLDKVRAISHAVDQEMLRELLENLKRFDSGLPTVKDDERLGRLGKVGPIAIQRFGSFFANDLHSYEEQVGYILKSFVDPEGTSRRVRHRKSRLFTEVKQAFRQQRVLAQKDENLSSHRIVPGWELAEGLVADLVLQNGAYHVVETVDIANPEAGLRKAVTDIAVSALILEQARIRFGRKSTKGRLVYTASSALEAHARPSLEAAEHQGAELINWASASDRKGFIRDLSSLAEPVMRGGKKETPGFLNQKKLSLSR